MLVVLNITGLVIDPLALSHGSAIVLVVAGTTFALIVMAIMWKAVLPLSPNGAMVKDSASVWVWILGHVAYGMTAGLSFARWR